MRGAPDSGGITYRKKALFFLEVLLQHVRKMSDFQLTKDSLVSSTNQPSSDETSSNSSLSPQKEKNNRKRKYEQPYQFISETSSGSTSSTAGTGTVSVTASERSGSESPIEDIDIPFKTSEWADNILHLLHINVVHEVFEPYVVFNSFSDFFSVIENQKKIKILTMFSSKNSLKPYAIKNLYDFALENIISLDYEEIYSIPRTVVHGLCEETKNLKEDFMQKWINATVPIKLEREGMECSHEFKLLCTRIYVRVNDFLQQLLYMTCEKKRCGETDDLKEGMFQELFVRFAKIFGLDFVSVPNVSRQTIKIGEKEVTSVPDALLLDPLQKDDKSFVFAVVEVKKNYSKEEDTEIEKNLRSSVKKPKGVQHIDSKLRGQHVGEMLSVLPYSMFGPSGIFGFIVQATEVTVVAFAANEDFMGKIKSGSLPKKECATIKYSEKCNILKRSGRLALAQTMLDMGNLMEYLRNI